MKRPPLIVFVFFLAIILLPGKLFSGNPADSLKKLLKNSDLDTGKVAQLNALAWELKNTDPDSAIYFGTKALQLSEDLKWNKGIAIAHQQLGVFHYFLSDYYIALGHYKKALSFGGAIEISDTHYKMAFNSKTYGYMGLALANQGEMRKALDYYFEALKIDEELGNKPGIAKHSGNIGIVYFDQKHYDKALEYYFKALKMAEELGLKQLQANTLGNIALVYAAQGEKSKALNRYLEVLVMAQEQGYVQLEANTLGNIGEIYKQKGEFNKALETFNQALLIKEKLGEKREIAITLGAIGELYLIMKKIPEAETYLKKAFLLSRSIRALTWEKEHAANLSALYRAKGDWHEAFNYYHAYAGYNDSLVLEENQREIERKELRFEYEKKAAADSIRNAELGKVTAAQLKAQEEELKREATQRYALYGGLALMVVFGLFMYNRVLVIRKQKHTIESQKAEVELQRDIARREHEIATEQKILIEIKNKEILDSIHYAKRIQNALLASEQYIERNLNKLNKK